MTKTFLRSIVPSIICALVLWGCTAVQTMIIEDDNNNNLEVSWSSTHSYKMKGERVSRNTNLVLYTAVDQGPTGPLKLGRKMDNKYLAYLSYENGKYALNELTQTVRAINPGEERLLLDISSTPIKLTVAFEHGWATDSGFFDCYWTQKNYPEGTFNPCDSRFTKNSGVTALNLINNGKNKKALDMKEVAKAIEEVDLVNVAKVYEKKSKNIDMAKRIVKSSNLRFINEALELAQGINSHFFGSLTFDINDKSGFYNNEINFQKYIKQGSNPSPDFLYSEQLDRLDKTSNPLDTEVEIIKKELTASYENYFDNLKLKFVCPLVNDNYTSPPATITLPYCLVVTDG